MAPGKEEMTKMLPFFNFGIDLLNLAPPNTWLSGQMLTLITPLEFDGMDMTPGVDA